MRSIKAGAVKAPCNHLQGRAKYATKGVRMYPIAHGIGYKFPIIDLCAGKHNSIAKNN